MVKSQQTWDNTGAPKGYVNINATSSAPLPTYGYFAGNVGGSAVVSPNITWQQTTSGATYTNASTIV